MISQNGNIPKPATPRPTFCTAEKAKGTYFHVTRGHQM
jgi:hypothetical protein